MAFPKNLPCVVGENCSPYAVALAPRTISHIEMRHAVLDGIKFKFAIGPHGNQHWVYVPVCEFHLDGWFDGGDFTEEQSPPVVRL